MEKFHVRIRETGTGSQVRSVNVSALPRAGDFITIDGMPYQVRFVDFIMSDNDGHVDGGWLHQEEVQVVVTRRN